METIKIINNLIENEPKEKQDVLYMLLSFVNNVNNDNFDCTNQLNKVIEKETNLYHYFNVFISGYYNIKTNYKIK